MENTQYSTIQSVADVQVFQDTANGLHDGYITYVEYRNSGIASQGNYLSFDHSGRSLVIHVRVTSLPGDPTFEILFRGVAEWQIKEADASDITDVSILFLDDGRMLWADDCTPCIPELKQGSYVVAESIQYRRL